jgi:hypothetical protein
VRVWAAVAALISVFEIGFVISKVEAPPVNIEFSPERGSAGARASLVNVENLAAKIYCGRWPEPVATMRAINLYPRVFLLIPNKFGVVAELVRVTLSSSESDGTQIRVICDCGLESWGGIINRLVRPGNSTVRYCGVGLSDIREGYVNSNWIVWQVCRDESFPEDDFRSVGRNELLSRKRDLLLNLIELPLGRFLSVAESSPSDVPQANRGDRQQTSKSFQPEGVDSEPFIRRAWVNVGLGGLAGLLLLGIGWLLNKPNNRNED